MKNRLDVKVSLFQNCKASGMPVPCATSYPAPRFAGNTKQP